MSRRCWWIAAPLAVVLSLCFLAPASATVVPLSAPELAAASPHVVVAVVESAESRWDRSLIVTDYPLRIEERLRGDAPDRVTISIPGGTVGDETHETSLSFPLKAGARYLLFLGDLDRPTLTPVTGGWQGAFREEDPAVFSKTAEAALALVKGEPGPPLGRAALPRTKREKYTIADLAVPPVAWNVALPAGLFLREFERQLAYWNVYGGDLFQIASTSPDWTFGDGVFDFVGFPNDATMNARFGRSWGAGSVSFIIRRLGDGKVLEAAIALNPGRPWTVAPWESTRPGGPSLYQDHVLGALGFAWGLRYQFEIPGNPFDFQEAKWDSVLSLRLPQYQLATLFADDTAAVRAAFGGASLRDGLISSYTTRRTGSISLSYIPAVPVPSLVRPGAKFNLSSIKIENPGTVPLAKPAIEVYLVPSRFSLDGAILVKRLRVSKTVPSGGVLNVNPGKVTVPASTPAGTYFLAFVLKDAKDVFQPNNRAWSDYNVTVRVVR